MSLKAPRPAKAPFWRRGAHPPAAAPFPPPPRRALTLGAVLAGPTGQAGQGAVRLANVVSEAVVAAFAEAGAALSVVVLAADHPVGVTQLGEGAALHVL